MYKQTHNGVVTTYLYDGVEPISDYDSSNRVLRRYINGAGIDERLLYFGYRTSDGAKTDHWYYHTDHQGSVIAMRKSTGSYHKYTYDSFGDLKSGTTVQPFQYTGRRWDAATGLYYYRARFYNSQIGRFMQTDPIGYEDQMNLYAYVDNDPMNFNDASGKAPNKAGATDYKTIIAIIKKGGIAALANNSSNTNRYFHTKDYGWVDTRHFATAAGYVESGIWGTVVEGLGFGLEVKQWFEEWGNDYRSGFSPEDLPSNSAGVDFGGLLEDNPNVSREKLFEVWAKSVGAATTGNSAYQNALGQLPATDPAYRGTQARGGSNASSTPNGNSRSNDTGSSGANSSTQKKCSYTGSRIKRDC